MKGSSPRVPQQDNFSDCGVYVLQYVESFFEVRTVSGGGAKGPDASTNLRSLFKTESHPQFPPAHPALRLVSAATDEDEAQRDQGADPPDPAAPGGGAEAARAGSAQLLRGAGDPTDFH